MIDLVEFIKEKGKELFLSQESLNLLTQAVEKNREERKREQEERAKEAEKE
jgi:hypothetical protein